MILSLLALLRLLLMDPDITVRLSPSRHTFRQHLLYRLYIPDACNFLPLARRASSTDSSLNPYISFLFHPVLLSSPLSNGESS